MGNENNKGKKRKKPSVAVKHLFENPSVNDVPLSRRPKQFMCDGKGCTALQAPQYGYYPVTEKWYLVYNKQHRPIQEGKRVTCGRFQVPSDYSLVEDKLDSVTYDLFLNRQKKK